MLLLLIALALVAVLVYIKVIKPLKFWEEKGVAHVKPVFIFGNMAANVFRKRCFGDLTIDLCNEFPNDRYFGIYQFLQPTLILKDSELIKQITVKDFDYFPEHRTFISEDADPLWAKNLFATKGEKWREMRPTLSPSFTSSKMKFMYTLMKETSEQFTQYFKNKTSKPGDVFDVEFKDAFTRYTNDVIASTAFGLKCDSLKEQNNEFYLMGKDATDFSGFRGLKFFFYSLSPYLMKKSGIKIFSSKVSTFFRRIVKDNIRSREAHGIVRPDMIHLLLEARKGRLKHEEQNGLPDTGFATVDESSIGKSEKKMKSEITDDDITAQALIFFLAGFDTAATLMCYIAYELAKNPDVQQTLLEEIDKVYEECKGNITYEALMKMKYMDMVVSETLRKWPPSVITDRVSVKPYTIQPVKPTEKPLTLEKGSILWLPIYALHRDPKIYPEPEKFDPERFSDENKGKIDPYSYIPFGSGPRNCIGSRFAILENKTIFFHILRNFEIVTTAKTPEPLVLSKKHFNLMVEGGFQLGLKRRV